MRRTRGVIVGALFVSLLAGCGKDPDASKSAEPAEGKGETLVKEADKGPVHLRVSVAPKAPRLSDLVEVTLQATAEAEVEIQPPTFGQAVGEFLVRDYHPLDPRLDGGKTVRGWVYKLEPVRSGKHLIRSMGITFVDHRAQSEAKDKTVGLEVDPFEIEVTSLLGAEKPDLGALAPMEDPRSLQPRPWPAWAWAAMASGAILLLAGVVYLRRRKKQSVEQGPVRTPEELAQMALETLMRERLPEQGLIVEFYVRLTGIVRQYVERKTGIHAPEQTTEEFLRAMQGDTRFDADLALQLGRFLEASDLVKYAAKHPDARDVEDAFRRAQGLVTVQAGRGLVKAPEPALAATSAGQGGA